MSDSPIQYVLFDAGGTLIGTNTNSEHWYEQFFVDACAEQGCVVSVGQVHDVLRRAIRSRHFDSLCSSDLQAREFWQHIYTTAFADLLGGKAINHTPAFITHLAADYIDRFEDGEFVQLFPDTREVLDLLKQRNVKLGIVSNFSTYLIDFLDKLDIKHEFDFILTSAAEGCEKPGQEIFQLAVNNCGVPASQILYVGDNVEEDYRPAKNIGMHALLIDRHNRHKDVEDCVRINRLNQVCDYLESGVSA